MLTKYLSTKSVFNLRYSKLRCILKKIDDSIREQFNQGNEIDMVNTGVPFRNYIYIYILINRYRYLFNNLYVHQLKFILT